MFKTHKAARLERDRLRAPHRIVPVKEHDRCCLISDGLIVSAHRCTCGKGEKTVGYVLVLEVRR